MMVADDQHTLHVTSSWHDLQQIERKRLISQKSDACVSRKWSIEHCIPPIPEESETLTDLAEDLQDFLKVAACLESLDKQLVSAVIGAKSNVSLLYTQASGLGLIVEQGTDQYSFMNTETQEAAYRMISNKAQFHLSVGRKLVKNLDGDVESHLPTVLRQFYHGRDLISSRNERQAVAAMTRRAAEQAVSSQANFTAASMYLEFGIDLLNDHNNDTTNPWKENYDLTLSLYNAAAEVEYCTANIERMDMLVSQVLENSRTFRDSLLARATRVYSLGGRGRPLDAVQEGLDVLQHLGVFFPKRIRTIHLWRDQRRTKHLLKNKTREMILRIPQMSDPDKIAAMQMLNLIFPNLFKTDSRMAFLVASRMVQLSLEHGISAISSVGFSMYGTMICVFGENSRNEAVRYGQLALALLEKFQAREWLPRVYFGVYGNIYSHQTFSSLQQVIDPMHDAYCVGMETGDIEFAMLNASMRCVLMLFGGRHSLPELEKQALEYHENMETYKQIPALIKTRPMIQFVQTMMDKTGELAEQWQDLDIQLNNQLQSVWLYFQSMISKYIFADYDGAEQDGLLFRHYREHVKVRTNFGFLTMMETLTLLAVCNNRPRNVRKKHLAVARRNIQILRKEALICPRDSVGKLFLVEAEMAAVLGQDDVARCKYICAIAVAMENDIKSDHAIACERAGRYMMAKGDDDSATDYLRKAHASYGAWGTVAKVNQMESEMPAIFGNGVEQCPPA